VIVTASIPMAGVNSAHPSSSFESSFDSLLPGSMRRGPFQHVRWMGWRLRALVLSALLGCVGLFAMSSWLASAAVLPGTWRATPAGQAELVATQEPALQLHIGKTLVSVRAPGGEPIPVDARLLQLSGRWIPGDSAAADHAQRHQQLSVALAQPSLELRFADSGVVATSPRARGHAAFATTYWLLCGIALLLYLVALVVLLSRPNGRNLLYALMSLCQVGNLLLLAIGTGEGLGRPAGFPEREAGLRIAFDLVSAASIAHACTLLPTRLPHGRWAAAAAWALALGLAVPALNGSLPDTWLWAQAGTLALGLGVIALLTWSYGIEPHPFAVLLRRFAFACVGTFLLLTLAVGLSGERPGSQAAAANVGPVIFHVFFAALLLLVPFLSRSQQLMREFALVASVSTVATALDLVFVAVFSLGQFASLTLTLFVALGVYAGARQWMTNRLLGSSVVTTERMFEQLYRIAREVEANPADVVPQLSRLLRELFEPLELLLLDKPSTRARVVNQGSALLVPVPELELAQRGPGAPALRTIAIRFARRGRRLFTAEDARLAERIVEQLRRAIAFDKAVEQGRSEERARLAQDLHDDIGARLLTLMYKAQTPEMEDYVRHTLQDLKTLTRGLAASSHRLSHAAGEWKADLTQRLSVAHIELAWTMHLEQDLQLSVVQWSGLTRVLRELASNSISHARATRVEIDLDFADDRLDLRVADNGVGRNPQAWAHGLGLGGVRKRVKQLGGEVEWLELVPTGIACKVSIREFSQRR
jgi:signal transduction histidine kinase